jgi:hypothetical protein
MLCRQVRIDVADSISVRVKIANCIVHHLVSADGEARKEMRIGSPVDAEVAMTDCLSGAQRLE